MSLDQLKGQVSQLPVGDQRTLIAYMVSLQTDRDLAFRQELTRKIEDQDPAHWMELDAVRKRTALV